AVDRVSESPATDGFVAVSSVAALRRLARETSAALAARGDGSDNHAIALCVSGHAETDRRDDADRFVPDGESFPHRIFALQDVNIRPADRGDARSDERLT